jgi:hypothetical protein
LLERSTFVHVHFGYLKIVDFNEIWIKVSSRSKFQSPPQGIILTVVRLIPDVKRRNLEGL